MNPQHDEARRKALAAIATCDGDNECDHYICDKALLAFLREIGEGGLADAWVAAEKRCDGFWYA